MNDFVAAEMVVKPACDDADLLMDESTPAPPTQQQNARENDQTSPFGTFSGPGTPPVLAERHAAEEQVQAINSDGTAEIAAAAAAARTTPMQPQQDNSTQRQQLLEHRRRRRLNYFEGTDSDDDEPEQQHRGRRRRGARDADDADVEVHTTQQQCRRRCKREREDEDIPWGVSDILSPEDDHLYLKHKTGWKAELGMPSAAAAAAAKAAAVEWQQCMTEQGKNAFIKVMTKSQVSPGFWMGVETKMKQVMGSTEKQVILHCDDSRDRPGGYKYQLKHTLSDDSSSWEATYLAEFKKDGTVRDSSGPGLSGGWGHFAIDQRLFPKDVVGFDIIDDKHIQVYLFRAAKYETRAFGSNQQQQQQQVSAAAAAAAAAAPVTPGPSTFSRPRIACRSTAAFRRTAAAATESPGRSFTAELEGARRKRQAAAAARAADDDTAAAAAAAAAAGNNTAAAGSALKVEPSAAAAFMPVESAAAAVAEPAEEVVTAAAAAAAAAPPAAATQPCVSTPTATAAAAAAAAAAAGALREGYVMSEYQDVADACDQLLQLMEVIQASGDKVERLRTIMDILEDVPTDDKRHNAFRVRYNFVRYWLNQNNKVKLRHELESLLQKDWNKI